MLLFHVLTVKVGRASLVCIVYTPSIERDRSVVPERCTDSLYMAKIKTRDLILEVALVLLNSRGESQVTSVDIAQEMNISPGNLYYHFKGKEEIVVELYAQFHARAILAVEEILEASSGHAKEILMRVSLASDIFQQYRFIGHDVYGLADRYPEIKPQLGKLFKKLHAALKKISTRLLSHSKVKRVDFAAEIIANNMLFTMLNLKAYDALLGRDEGYESSVEEHVFMQLMPFIHQQEESE